jgi:multiple sugar transport system permease protein
VTRYGGVAAQRARAGGLFLLPSMLVLAVFVYWPLVAAFQMSLQRFTLGAPVQPFVGLDNYARLLDDERFRGALWNTLVYTLGTVVAAVVVSLGLALALNRQVRGIAWLRGVFFLPVITSMAIVAIAWTYLLDADIGAIAAYLRDLGFPVRAWLRDPDWAMPAVMAVGLWKNVGFYMVIFLAGLQGIPETYYEAAAIDGAGPWQRFRRITLPLLAPTTLFVTVIAVISSFQVFDPVYVMTGGGPLFRTETLVQYIYTQGFQNFRMGYASAMAFVLLGIVLVLTLVQMRVNRAGMSGY